MKVARIQAIIEKDIKDFMKNSMTVFMPAVPIILALFYSRMGTGIDEEIPLMIIYLVIGVSFATVTTNSMMALMAEENEKKTLRGLMMSPASYIEIIIGKSLVVVVLTFTTLIVSLYIMGSGVLLDVQHIIGIFVLFFFFLLLGIGVGLFVKTVGMTTAYSMPIMLLFGFSPVIESLGFDADGIIMKVATYMPINQLVDMEETGSWGAIGIVLIWTVVAGIFTIVRFQKLKKERE